MQPGRCVVSVVEHIRTRAYACVRMSMCRSAADVLPAMANILSYGGNMGSISLYMAHGGTNFGFWAGSNSELKHITSYDYVAPISESGATGMPGPGGANKFDVRIDSTIAMAVNPSRAAARKLAPRALAHPNGDQTPSA